MIKVVVPFSHGVEFKQIPQDYAKPLIERVSSYLTKEEREYFIPAPYNYTTRTDPRQKQAFEATDKGLGNEELRRLKHSIGSDITWSFIIAKDGNECFYTDFVADMAKVIDTYKNQYPSCKVLCVGHSQGTQLFYSFFFDYAKYIDGFISMGSPISMNSGAYPNWGMRPKNLGSWINFYHTMDFVSSKLEGCHKSKAIADFVKDYEVPQGWNPLYWFPGLNHIGVGICGIPLTRLIAGLEAHVSYWTSDFVAKIIAGKIKELMYQS